MSTRLHRFSYADLERIPEGADRLRRELFDGELVVTPSPNRAHQTLATRLTALLWRHASERALGEVWTAPLDVVFDRENVYVPDLLFVSHARRAAVAEAHLVAAPDVVVEILSSSTRTRDLTRKKDLYARFGVPHYWVFDPRERTFATFERDAAGAFVSRISAEAPAIVSAAPFADLPLDLAALFAPPFGG
jgi:Uma2 family endonuclease